MYFFAYALKCCQGQSKITQSLKNTVCASAQISLRRLCFSSICVDLMSARQSGLVRRIVTKNKHFLSMGFGGDLVATLVDRRVARSSDAAKNLAWIGFLLRRDEQAESQTDGYDLYLGGPWLPNGRVAVPNLCVVVPNLRISCVVPFRRHCCDSAWQLCL